MEAAGLALAGPPLLVELIKQTINAYKLFIDAKAPENSMKHFYVRLAIEHRRLSQWGEDTGLITPSGLPQQSNRYADNRLLENQGLRELIKQTLECIDETLRDATALAKRYGMSCLGSFE